MEAVNASTTARQRQEEGEEARAKATAVGESDAPAGEQAELNRNAEMAEAWAKLAEEKAIEAAENVPRNWSLGRLRRCLVEVWPGIPMAPRARRPSGIMASRKASPTPISTAVSCSKVRSTCRAITSK